MTEKKDEITVVNLKALCKHVAEMRAELDVLSRKKADTENAYKALCRDLIEKMESLDLKSFDDGENKFIIRNQPYAKIIDRDALASFLKREGVFDDFYTFNAQKMNSYFKERLEEAREARDLDFEIDGMEMTSNRQTISIRKGK